MPGPWPRRLSVLVAPASWAPPARRCGWVESRGVRHRGRNVPGMLGAAYLWPGMCCGIISRQPSRLWNNHPGGVAETPVRLCLPRQPSGVCTEPPPVAEAHVSPLNKKCLYVYAILLFIISIRISPKRSNIVNVCNYIMQNINNTI